MSSPAPSLRSSLSIWLEALLTSLLCSSAFLLFIGRPSYESNDDMGMDMIAAGVWASAKPSALLLFIHPLYGGVLSRLYSLWPDVGWHGVVLLTLTALALASLHAAVLRVRRSGMLRLFLLLLVATATGLCMTNVQFTLVAGLCFTAGTVLGLSQVLQPATDGRIRLFERGVTLVMLLIGAMLRLDSALMVAALSVPLWGGVFYLRSIAWRRMAPALLTLAAVLALVRLSAGLYYGDAGWQRWQTLNTAKSEIIDTQRVVWNEVTAPVFARHGITRNDYDMLASWQYLDSQRIVPEKLAAAVQEALTLPGAGADGAKSSQGMLADLLAKISKTIQLHALFWALPACLLLLHAWGWRRFGVIAWVWGSVFLLLLYLDGIVNRLPLRVMAVGLLFANWSTLLLLCLPASADEYPLDDRKRRLLGLLGLALLIYSLQTFHLYCVAWTGFAEKNATGIEERLAAWQRHLPPDAVLYNVGGAIAVDSLSPLRPIHSLPLADAKVISLGWLNQSPHMHRYLTSIGLDAEAPYLAIARQPHVYFAQQPKEAEFYQYATALRQYYREQHGLDFFMEKDPQLPGLFKMKFQPYKPAQP